MESIAKLNFGDYCIIEQHRYVSENEQYLHKVIGRGRSNSYVNVPVTGSAEAVLHGQVVDTISCICCGVDETDVFTYRLEDVQLNTIYNTD